MVRLYRRFSRAGDEKKPAAIIPEYCLFGARWIRVLERIRMLILNAVVLNLLTGVLLFVLARMYERRIFIPAKMTPSGWKSMSSSTEKSLPPRRWGSVFYVRLDGTNILSNELAHNYLNMPTHEQAAADANYLRQQVNFVDVLTSITNLQISFVHSRYRNENVAICVLVDVRRASKWRSRCCRRWPRLPSRPASRNQCSSPPSATNCAPLYGIIGNLDLLQTKEAARRASIAW